MKRFGDEFTSSVKFEPIPDETEVHIVASSCSRSVFEVDIQRTSGSNEYIIGVVESGGAFGKWRQVLKRTNGAFCVIGEPGEHADWADLVSRLPVLQEESEHDGSVVRVHVEKDRAVFVSNTHRCIRSVSIAVPGNLPSLSLCVLRCWDDTRLVARSVTTVKSVKRAKQHAAHELGQALLSDKDFTDAVLITGCKEVPVHRAVLAAASDVFAIMLKSTMREGREARLDLGDFGDHVVEVFVKYMYTRSASELSKVADLSELFALASKYMMHSLVLDVGEMMVASVDSGNAVKYARVLRQHACTGNVDAMQLWESMFERLHTDKDLVRRIAEQLLDLPAPVGT